MKPGVRIANRRNLEFEGLFSEYSVGTAGSEDIGRSMTFQLFHGSECAFWPNTDELMTGVLQGVADVPGSEIVFESTAKGMGNLFYKMAMNGLNPESEFMTIFIPWFWQDEYQKPVPAGFTPTADEEHLIQTYGLTNEQVYWRRRKIEDVFGSEIWKFQREYPCSIQEAFITSGKTLVPAELVDKARKTKVKDPAAPLVMGVDPARTGDRTVIVFRRGREVLRKLTYTTMDEMTLAGIIAKFIDDDAAIQKCFIDVGLGYGTVDRLRELGYGNVVTGIHFGSGALESDVYQNKRVEMYDHMLRWFMEGGVSIPDDDEFVSDILAIPPFEQTTGRGVLSLTPKEKIIEEYGKSPDHADALCFCAGTKISTPWGKRNIEDLRAGDKVCTPFGDRFILTTHISQTSTLTKVKFSDDKTLVGRPQHKLFSFKGGLVRLDMLSLDNGIETDSITRRMIWRILNLCYTKDKNIGFKAQAAIFSPEINVTRKDFYIDGYTPIILALSLKVLRSIMLMIIGGIIRLRISFCEGYVNMHENICVGDSLIHHIENETEDFLNEYAPWLLPGIARKRGESGTLNMENKPGSGERQKIKNVLYVEKNTQPFSTAVVSAPTHVIKKRVIFDIKLHAVNVWSVVKGLFLTSTGLKPVVPVDVQTDVVDETNVYNITLDHDNVYYANGVLVENCLTFAFPVNKRNTTRVQRKEPEMVRKNSPLSTIRRVAGKKDNSAGFRSSFRLS
jgi:hypothetical protein